MSFERISDCLLAFQYKTKLINILLSGKVVFSPEYRIGERKSSSRTNIQLQKTTCHNALSSTARKTSLLTPLAGSLTVEAAVTLPVFVICMALILWFGRITETAVRFSGALTETAEEMAIGAYLTEYGGSNESLLGVALTDAFATARVLGKSGDRSCVKNANLLLSNLMEEDDAVDLILTYQAKTPLGGVRLPWIFFVQRGRVRAWTGREGSGGSKKDGSGEDKDGNTVYVTEHGQVYHTDRNCTYLNPSIRRVHRSDLKKTRNASGGKYHVCEYCGSTAGDEVYITDYGDRYHSSASCSRLQRTVRKMDKDEVGHLRPCSKCAGGHGHSKH